MTRPSAAVLLALLVAPSSLAASLSGIVESATSGEPLAGAVVALGPADNSVGTAASALSASDGTFVIPDVEPGVYRLIARKAGYQSRPTRGVPVQISANRDNQEFPVQLWAESAVGGRVFDSEDEPVAEAQVRAYAASHSSEGSSFELAASAKSDDHGEYRIFGLRAGKYLLQVSRPGPGSPSGVYYQDVPASYYPSAVSPAQALLVDVGWGQDQPGIDLRLSGEPAFAAAGTVFDVEAEGPCGACSLQAFHRDGNLTVPLPDTVEARRDGAYLLRGLAPGDYRLVASRRGSDSDPGFLDIAVRGRHVDTAHLTVGVRQAVSGSIALDQAPDGLAVGDWILVLTPLGMPRWWTVSRGYAESDGSFEMEDLAPGPYQLSFRGLPPGAYLVGLDAGGRTAPATIDVRSDTPLDRLRPVVAFDGAAVTGRVADPAAPVRVCLLPRDRAKLAASSQSVETSPDGAFRFHSIPPGDYALYAVDSSSPESVFDPAVQSRLQRFARQVSLGPGEQVNIVISRPDP